MRSSQANCDRLALEVVAEGEVAEHLEEGVVARGVADVLEVVVLAARAHAALRAGRAHVGALLLAEEHVLELHHAGVGEQQRRIVAGHERELDATIGGLCAGNNRGKLLAQLLRFFMLSSHLCSL